MRRPSALGSHGEMGLSNPKADAGEYYVKEVSVKQIRGSGSV